MAPRSHLITGLVLGAAAGTLLGLAVLPLGLNWSGYGHPAALAFYLRPWTWLTALLMALGGLGVTRSKHALEAVKAFSLAGLLGGAVASACALDASPPLLAAAGLTGWLYGLVAVLPLLRLAGGGHDRPAAAAALPAAGPPTSDGDGTAPPTGPRATAGLDGDAI